MRPKCDFHGAPEVEHSYTKINSSAAMTDAASARDCLKSKGDSFV